ncbi:MAG: hypothetical protein KDE27_01070 [Planctomycetes bacterium]|nr:hypothetical protein [Planctomycetota bacterium]
MKGDYTRSTFDRRNRFSGVRMQQGRVQLDADWNEQIDLTRDRIETGALDLIGGCGAPLHYDGFRVLAGTLTPTAEELARSDADPNPPVPSGTDDFLVTAGRYYLDGILAESDAIARYRDQPYLPDPGDVANGTYVVYLDVFDRHRTALEEPDIREVALDGPDTATRTQTIWQVKLLEIAASTEAPCIGTFSEWTDLTTPPNGTMAARAEEQPGSDDPCIVTPGAGYRALENRLYRVEVHDGGDLTAATFKWSRDNGTVVAAWISDDSLAGDVKTITVSTLGRDDVLRFVASGWVELTDDDRELRGESGTLVRVLSAEGKQLALDVAGLAATAHELTNFPTNPRVRRWDDVIEQPPADEYRGLEDGVEVAFAAGSYRTGDYWLVPARTASGDVEWPLDDLDDPIPSLPHGIEHHYCRLAVMTLAGGSWSDPSDCRRLFPPVTELTSMFYVGGDGQEATPEGGAGGVELEHALQVGVANGRWPVEGATIRFHVEDGGGSFAGTSPLSDDVQVSTSAEGIASVRWTLGDVGEAQKVRAYLEDAAGERMHLPIDFTARYREGGAAEPGARIEEILAGGTRFVNDATLATSRLRQGFEIRCDTRIRAQTVTDRKPVCFVTLHLPWPVTADEFEVWGPAQPVATQAIRLDATIEAQDHSIFWRPSRAVADWLDRAVAVTQSQNTPRDSVLGYLTLKGNFIWDDGDPDAPRYLDAESYGALRADGGTDAVLPSGDARRGGDLEVWFHLVSVTQPEIEVPEALNFGITTANTPLGGEISVSNPGTATLVVTAMAIVDDPSNPGWAALFAHQTALPEVEPNGSSVVNLGYFPTAAGNHSAILQISSNAGPAEVRLLGTANGQRGARVQFVHMSSRAGSTVSIAIDGAVVVPSLAQFTGTEFRTYPAGTVTVRAAVGGQTLTETEIEFEAGRAYLVVLGTEPTGAATLTIVPAGPESPEVLETPNDPSAIQLRVFNPHLEAYSFDFSSEPLLGSFALGPLTAVSQTPDIQPQLLFAIVFPANNPALSREFRFGLTTHAGRSMTLFTLPIASQLIRCRIITDQGLIIDPEGASTGSGGTGTGSPGSFGLLSNGRITASSRGLELAINRTNTTEVRGIGEAMSARLRENGIGSVGRLATTDPSRVSSILGIGSERATTFVNEARGLAGLQ